MDGETIIPTSERKADPLNFKRQLYLVSSRTDVAPQRGRLGSVGSVWTGMVFEVGYPASSRGASTPETMLKRSP